MESVRHIIDMSYPHNEDKVKSRDGVTMSVNATLGDDMVVKMT